jgi:hypothetical protein
MTEKICQYCNNPFNYGNQKNKKYCNQSCQVSHRNKLVKEKRISVYNQSPNYCKHCNISLPFDKRSNTYCSHVCSATATNKISPDWKRGPEKSSYPYSSVKFITCPHTGKVYCNKNSKGFVRKKSPYVLDDKEIYYQIAKFSFNVYNFPEEFDLHLIELFGWYTCPGRKRKNMKKNTLGVSRDHIISIAEGFQNNYDPKHISHPANCRLVTHIENKNKGTNSLISYNELLERINSWDKKYPKFLGY